MTLVAGCGGSDDGGTSSKKPDAGTDANSDATGDSPSAVCTDGDFRCTGDLLETCNANQTAFQPVATCKVGLCDAPGKQCDNCVAGEGTCEALGGSYTACDATGQKQETTACPAPTPFCSVVGGKPTCVECKAATDCPASANECQLSACSSTGSCGFSPKSQGTSCGSGSGQCDGVGQCNVCTPGSKTCNGNVPLVCGSNGQYAAQPACSGGTPNCDPTTATCVQCTSASQCPPASSPCLIATCSANSCGFANAPNGTACTFAGEPGTCASATCKVCTTGQTRCKAGSSNTVQTCDSNGQWQDGACPGGTPLCLAGLCVECLSPNDCPTSANECLGVSCTSNQCGFSPKSQGTSCGSGSGQCDGAGQCNVCAPGSKTCNGNVPLVCGSNGQYAAQPACSGGTPNCDPTTATCVQCTSASQCPAASSPCLVATCSANSCGFANAPNGTACTFAGEPGTCASATCKVCTTGQTRCKAGSSNTVQTCDSNGQWQDSTCSGGTPFCSGGVCAVSICGNGTIEGTEQCDDNNSNKCDGCEGCEKRHWLNVPINAYADIPGLASKLPSGNACYELWAKHSAITDAVYFAVNTDSTHSNLLLRCLGGSALQFGSQNAFNTVVTQPSAPCGNGVWHHVAGCRAISGSQVTYNLYFDGQLVGSVTGSTSSIAAPGTVRIGGLAYTTEGIGGAVDELRISDTLRYTAAFTPERRHAVDANTIALFHFDEGSGTTATDASTNQITATLMGASWAVDTGYAASMCQ